MRCRVSHLPGVALLLPVLLLAAPLAEAGPMVRNCAKGEHAVPDERGKGNLCVSAKAWAEAHKICAAKATKGRKIDPKECLCQDGDTVGPCGN